jgi:TonB family protein
MIAYAMLYTVLVSVPLGVAAWFVARFLRAHGRPERGVWMVALAATLLFPAFTLSRPRSALADRWLPAIQVEAVSLAAAPTSAAMAPARSLRLDLDGLLLIVWGFASLALAARWALSAARLRSLRASWLTDTIDGVRVALTPEMGPAVTGVLRPQIIVPAWVPALPANQRALVLLHEQEHVRARDPWLTTLARISRVIAPWNPVTWLLGVGLRRAVELDCDRRVLRRHPSVESYGETLLMVSARGSDRLLAAAAFAETDVPLRKRILAMTTPPRAMSVLGVLLAIAVGTVILGSTAAVPVPAMRVVPLPAFRVPAVMVTSAPAPEVVMPSPLREVVVTTPASQPVSISQTATAEVQQVNLPDPRVIAEPWGRWMVIYRSINDVRAGIAPIMRVPWSSRDSAFAALNAELGDSAAILRPVALDMLASPSDPLPLPPFDVNPGILNHAEIVQAIGAAYPPGLRDRGLGGTVGMEFLVGVTGEVERLRIGQISAYPALDRAALQVAGVYRFSPALRRNEPVAVWVSHAISFYPPQ